MEGPFYTIREVSGLLKVSTSTIRRSIRDGRLQASRVGSGRQIRISEAAVSVYLGGEPGGNGRSPSSSDGVVAVRGSESPSSRDTSVRQVEGQLPSGAAWTLFTGDVRLALTKIPNESVACAVTSPPYYWQRDYEVDGQIGHEKTIDEYVAALVETFRELRRTLKNDGTLFLNLGDTYYSKKGRPHGRDDKHNGRQMMRRQLRAVDGPGLGLPRKSLIGIPWRVALAMQDDGWTLRSDIVWRRPGTLPEPSAKDRPWRTSEHVFLFSKNARYWFDRRGLRGEEDIWTIVSRPDNPGVHFAPFPRELVNRCLDCGCPDGGVVLDPFVGSGTTMSAALLRGSSAIGIDLKPDYTDYVKGLLTKEFGSVTGESGGHDGPSHR